MNVDLLKRPAVYGTIAGVVLIAIIWWFAWMSPEGNKLNGVNAQAQSAQNQITQLDATVASLKAQSALLPGSLPFLAHYQVAIPNLPESGILTEQLFQLMRSTGTFISSLNDATVQPTGAGYSEVPVSIVITGSHNGILNFITDIYKLPRLVTIEQVSLTPSAGQPDLNKASTTNGFGATIAAMAYTTFVPPVVAP